MASGSLGAIDHDVAFDFDTSDALISAFNAAAMEIDGQAPTMASYVANAEQDFSGYFAQLFAQNATTAAGDGADLVMALKETATFAGELAQQAWAENQRRELARNYMAGRHANWAVEVGEWLMGDNNEQPPVGPPDEPLTKPVQAPRNRERHQLVGSGASGGVSSARPENLSTFATGSARLNGELSGLDVKLRSRLDDFTTRCTYGTLSADGVVTSLSKWLAANGKDVQWATTVAASFAAAGGVGGVDRLSNATLEAALAGAGVSQVRADIDIAMPSALGGAPTNGYTMDPVNTATGNFVEPEVDLAFAGGAATLALSRMYNSVDSRVGVFGPGWSSLGTSSIKWLSKNSSILTKASTMAISGASSAAGSLTRDAVSGSDPDYLNALANAAISGVTDRLPTDKLPWSRQNGLIKLQQMPYFAPRTVHGALDFSKINTRGMWGTAANGAVIGGGADLLQSFLGS